MEKNHQRVIGSTELIKVGNIESVPAKIDTGADTSAIWVSDVTMAKDGSLSFTLFNKKSPLYTGEKLVVTDYVAKAVRSSHGDEQIRYCVKLPIEIDGKSLVTAFTLADRTKNKFPVLIGRRTLEGNFLVDASKSSVERPKPKKSHNLNQELREDPYAFHRKYLNNDWKEKNENCNFIQRARELLY